MLDSFDYISLGKRVRECRKEKDITQEMLAERTGISTSFVGHIERAEKQPSLETIVNLCRALNVSVDYLVLGRKRLCDPIGCRLREDLQKLVDAYPNGLQR